jgi:hypothetical protein
MLSRSRKNLGRRGASLDLQTPHSRSRENETPIRMERDRENIDTLGTTSPSHNRRRVMKIRRRTQENGVNIIKYLGTTLKNVSSRGSLVANMKASEWAREATYGNTHLGRISQPPRRNISSPFDDELNIRKINGSLGI